MNWTNPYEISTRISEEAVFLLPFSEIKQIFESVMITNYGKSISYTDSYENYLDNYENYLSSMEIDVSSVSLGYMKIQEKGDKNGAKLVPVWDFFGTISYYDMDTRSYVETQEDSLLQSCYHQRHGWFHTQSVSGLLALLSGS